MKLESLQVELRPRSSWEAMELGNALVRKHAAAIWKPWLLVTLPVFVLINVAGLAIGEQWAMWLAWFLMWWWRPLFDRIPLYVLSRAVFGTVPGWRETLRAQFVWGWRTMPGHLTWRRLSPMRASMLPIDLLEGATGALLSERRRVLGAGVTGHAMQLTVACWHFVFAVQFSLLALGLLVIPNEKLPAFADTLWGMVNQPLASWPWILLVLNIADYVAVSIIEPFYIGAGFGLYLNRRTQLEAWDVEIAFRRLRKRIEAGGIAMLLALALLSTLAATPSAQAEDAVSDFECAVGPDPEMGLAAKQEEGEKKTPARPPTTLHEIFGEEIVDARNFDKSVDQAYQDPLLKPKTKRTTWERRDREKDKKEKPQDRPQLKWLSTMFGFLAENILWLLFGTLVLLLVLTFKRWWPWLAGMTAPLQDEPAPVESQEIAHTEPLPPNIAEVARRLWRDGQPRRALALMYRASVAAMSARVDTHLPPGATEAECLRLSRRMPEAEDRGVFQRMVRVWQYAAYGQRLPEAEEFESLLQALSLRFRWSA
ncbi:MAG: DUF4129 domain-containing protein [Lysobacteraceae bacterium]|nr:MAG: DUF4129 domain-containing protein [Xanthomonadaceae bacterium]